ncbi:unnamed protein product [Closterium sp. Yama58-4]|nr:unnamed protein product [Closterium sp. Yama58-4]
MMQRLGVSADQIHSLLTDQGGVGSGEPMSEKEQMSTDEHASEREQTSVGGHVTGGREEGAEMTREGLGRCAVEDKQQGSEYSECSKSSNCGRWPDQPVPSSWPVPFLVLLHGSLSLSPTSLAEGLSAANSFSLYERDAYKGDRSPHEPDSHGHGEGDCNDVTRGCRGSSTSRSRSPAPSLSPSPSIPSLLSLGFDAVVRKPLRKPALLAALQPLFAVGTEQGECAGEGEGAGGRGKDKDAAQGGVRVRDEGHAVGTSSLRQWGSAALELVSPSALHKAGSSAAAALCRAVTSPRALTSPESLKSPQSLDPPHSFKLRRSHSPTTPTTPASDSAKSKAASPVAPRNTSPNANTGCVTSPPGKVLVVCEEEEASLEEQQQQQQQQGMDGNSASLVNRSASLEHLIAPAATAPAAAAPAASTGLASVAVAAGGGGKVTGGRTLGRGTSDGEAPGLGERKAWVQGSAGERRGAGRSRARQSDKRKSTNTRGAGGSDGAAASAAGGGGGGRVSGFESVLDFAGFSPATSASSVGTLSPALTTFEAPQKSLSVGTLSPALTSVEGPQKCLSVGTLSPALTRTPSPSFSPTPAPATPPPAFPTAAPPAAPAAAAVAQEPATVGERLSVLSGRRVMVVDDNVVNRKVASKLLERHGARVTAVDGGAKALQALAPPHPFELVFMDLQMPGMDGLEATRRIRARERAEGGGHVAIIALTADVIAGTRQQCFAVGMDDYLSKPLDDGPLSHAEKRDDKRSNTKERVLAQHPSHFVIAALTYLQCHRLLPPDSKVPGVGLRRHSSVHMEIPSLIDAFFENGWFDWLVQPKFFRHGHYPNYLDGRPHYGCQRSDRRIVLPSQLLQEQH